MKNNKGPQMILQLEDGSIFEGISFGAGASVSGEVVFNTGMVGYPESLTDPSYRGQILVLTYPLIGNYGVPKRVNNDIGGDFESNQIQVSGLIISDFSTNFSHWKAKDSLSEWLIENNIPAIYGIDTRSLTKKLREKGTMLGGLNVAAGLSSRHQKAGTETGHFIGEFNDPNKENLVAQVSCKEIKEYGSGKKRVVLVDCGVKNNIIRSLVDRGMMITQVPWDFDFNTLEYDGLFLTNGPGDPKMADKTIKNLQVSLLKKKPIFGICLGNQLLALAAGAKTYKLKYGHRSQNQPCLEIGTRKCVITSQNHGYAVERESLPAGWKVWFENANDRTIEGIKHEQLPYMSVQFHPEAKPGPVDTAYLFDEFAALI